MNTNNGMAFRIAEFLKDRFTHADLADALHDIAGIVVPLAAPDASSKRERILAALKGKSSAELAELSRRVGVYFKQFDLEEEGLRFLEKDLQPITEITRRDIAKLLGDQLAGERNPAEVVGGLFSVHECDLSFTETLADQIHKHMVRNPGDWSVELLFAKIGALSCSRDRFGRLLAQLVHPLTRRGAEQGQLVRQMNSLLKRDGYELQLAGEESGHPIYVLQALTRGVRAAAKNLIFASNGPKPEIGFADAINNDIVILSHAESCLIYDRPLRRDGLLWAEIVAWWKDLHAPGEDSAREVGRRLRASLSSDAERTLFDSFFVLYREKFGEALPALIPQVYLHYDPAVVKWLRSRAGLVRQRMDFLLLLPNFQRIVLEVDGSQHFSRDGAPSLPAYSEMVSADRDLRLSGYEVYRFGSNELVGAGARNVVRRFFDRLWQQHKIVPAEGS